jgi:hypothetical protein
LLGLKPGEKSPRIYNPQPSSQWAKAAAFNLPVFTHWLKAGVNRQSYSAQAQSLKYARSSDCINQDVTE